jgi:hypothetical protein
MKLTKGKLSKLFNKKKQSRKKKKYNKKKHRRNTYNNNNKNINLANKTLKRIIGGGFDEMPTNIDYNSEEEKEEEMSTNQNGFDSVNNMSNILSS